MKWKKRGLKVALPLWQSLIVILVVAVLFGYSYVAVDRYVVRQKMGDLMNLADAKYVHILDLLQHGKGLNRERAENINFREMLTNYESAPTPDKLKRIDSELDEIKEAGHMGRPHAFDETVETRDRSHEVLVMDKAGRVIVSTKPSGAGRNIAKSAMFRVGSKRTAVIDPFLDYDEEHAVFAFVSPIWSESGQKGEFLGVLVNKVDTGLLTMIMNADLGNIIGGKLWFAGFQYKALDLYVMDSRGRYITQSRLFKKDTVLKKKGSDLPLKRAIDKQATGDRATNVGIVTGAREAMDIYSNQSGVQVAGASMPLYDQGWTVVIEQPTRDAFAGLINLERTLIVGGLIAAFLAGLASWVAARRISDSLADLNAGAVQLAGGNLNTQFEAKPDEYKEIASLAASLELIRDNQKKNLNSTKDSNKRLHEIETMSKKAVEDMLEFIRPRELDVAEVSINDIIDDATGMILVPDNVIVQKDYDKSYPKAEVDRDKLIQALGNIISRGVDVMRDGGRLVIATHINHDEIGQVEVIITDNGPALESDNISRIFDPIFGVTARKINFALPLAKKLIEQHGGRIAVSVGEKGRGLVVKIRLPVKLQKAA